MATRQLHMQHCHPCTPCLLHPEAPFTPCLAPTGEVTRCGLERARRPHRPQQVHAAKGTVQRRLSSTWAAACGVSYTFMPSAAGRELEHNMPRSLLSAPSIAACVPSLQHRAKLQLTHAGAGMNGRTCSIGWPDLGGQTAGPMPLLANGANGRQTCN
jgi:hypothetical protein